MCGLPVRPCADATAIPSKPSMFVVRLAISPFPDDGILKRHINPLGGLCCACARARSEVAAHLS
jgi:hypothetical protein